MIGKEMNLNNLFEIIEKGGKGSGNHGHAGRPGKQGGSAPKGGGGGSTPKGSQDSTSKREAAPKSDKPSSKFAGKFIANRSSGYAVDSKGRVWGGGGIVTDKDGNFGSITTTTTGGGFSKQKRVVTLTITDKNGYNKPTETFDSISDFEKKVDELGLTNYGGPKYRMADELEGETKILD